MSARKPKDRRKVKEILADARDDYGFDPSVWNADDPIVREVKRVINEELTTADRTIILLYTELQSLRKLGAIFGVSHATMRKEVTRIRDLIIKNIQR